MGTCFYGLEDSERCPRVLGSVTLWAQFSKAWIEPACPHAITWRTVSTSRDYLALTQASCMFISE